MSQLSFPDMFSELKKLKSGNITRIKITNNNETIYILMKKNE